MAAEIDGQRVEQEARVNKYADVLIMQLGGAVDEFMRGSVDGKDRSARMQAVVHAIYAVAQKLEFVSAEAGLKGPTIIKLKAQAMTRAAKTVEQQMLQKQIAGGGGGIIQ